MSNDPTNDNTETTPGTTTPQDQENGCLCTPIVEDPNVPGTAVIGE
ncbi:hypothetical protein [Kocuria rosea]|nr:hypothetical protein [Kocuria rosea]